MLLSLGVLSVFILRYQSVKYEAADIWFVFVPLNLLVVLILNLFFCPTFWDWSLYSTFYI